MYVICLSELRFLVWKSVILRCSAHNLTVFEESCPSMMIGGGLETLLCPARGDWFDLFDCWLGLLLRRVGEESLLLIASLGVVVCFAGLLFVFLSLTTKSSGVREGLESVLCSYCAPVTDGVTCLGCWFMSALFQQILKRFYFPAEIQIFSQ